MKVNLKRRMKGLLGLALAVVTFVGLGSSANAAIFWQEYVMVADANGVYKLYYYAEDDNGTPQEDEPDDWDEDEEWDDKTGDDKRIFRETSEMIYDPDNYGNYNLMIQSGSKVIVEDVGEYDDYDEETKKYKGASTDEYGTFFVKGTTYYVKSIEKRTVDLSGSGLGTEVETSVLTLTTTPPATTSSSSSGTSQSSSHTHIFDWVTLKTPTATQDGLESYRCTQCGYSPNGNTPIAAYPYFVKEALKQIEKAPLNGTATIKSDIFGSVPASVMEAIAARPDLTVNFQLTYKHQKYEIEIPAGTTIDTNETYYGALKLAELYGLK